MSYMTEFAAELEKRLPSGTTEEAVTWIKEKVLESYRNGQRDCPKCSPRRQPRKS